MALEGSDNSASVQRLKRALLALEKMQARISELESASTEPIAIVGIGTRMPGGGDGPESFWKVLADGTDATSEVPPDRWDIDAYYDPDPSAPGKMYTRRGAFVGHLRDFDAQFFRISPREANSLDPQQRLALEVSWEALEHAGIAPDSLAASLTGVFLGIASTEYFQLLDRNNHDENDIYVGTGNTHSAAAGRISFILGLQGPCIAVDTACSSSLVSVHLACHSLRNRECNLALAGGVNRLVAPQVSVHFSKVHALSRDGRCKTFDASADGYGRGEGCGFVVLKRLSDAVRHRDKIHALIVGSAVNHDGASSGLTVPSGHAQQAVLRSALENANVRPEQVSYVEAHGTGTPLGDPIEIRALQAVYGKSRSADRPLLAGSVKTNIGHLEPAAGIAGLIKTVLALEHGEIPAHLHVQELSPHVSWSDCPLVIPRQKTEWPDGNGTRFAGISAFGFSGTNAHVIVRDYTPPAQEPRNERPLHVLTLSAKTENALSALVDRYRAHLETVSTDRIADICFTANAGRAHFQHRVAMVVDSQAAAVEQLQRINDSSKPTGAVRGNAASPPRIAFLFTGQGSQYAGMGRGLYDTQPAFRRTLEQCDEILRDELGQSIVSILYGSASDNADLHETRNTQPILFCLEYALAQLWRSWGVEPVALIGHSIGEYVAACIAEVFTLKDALKLVAARGRLMGGLPSGGGMFAVRADENTVGAAVREYWNEVSIAAVNGPFNTVISGTTEKLEAVVASLRARGINGTRLNVSHAFHSPLMDAILPAFLAVARDIQYFPPKNTLVSNVFGRIVTDEMAAPEYWVRQLREPVRYAQGIASLSRQQIGVFLEVGPTATLLGISRQCIQDQAIQYLPTLNMGKPDWQTLLKSLAALYECGAPIDWEAFDKDYGMRRVALPTYPFQRETFWIDSKTAPARRPALNSPALSSQHNLHPLLGRRVHLARSNGTVVFESSLSQLAPAFLNDHRVHNAAVAPAAAFLEMALAAARHVGRGDGWQVTDVSFEKALVLTGDETAVQLSLCPEGERRFSFEISSARPTDGAAEPTWVRHAAGFVTTPAVAPDWAPVELSSIQAQCRNEIPIDVFYSRCRERGVEYGSAFRGLSRAWQLSDGAVGHIKLPSDPTLETRPYRVHPALLDACLQPMGLLSQLAADNDAWIPLGLERLIVLDQGGTEAWSFVRSRPASNESQPSDLHVDALVYSPDGRLLAVVENLHVGRLNKAAFSEQPQDAWKSWLYDVQWHPLEIDKASDAARVHVGPNEIKERLLEELPGIIQRRPVLGSYLQGFSALEDAGFLFVLDAFQELGASLQVGDSFSTAELASRLKISAKQQQLFGRLLEVLADHNRLRREEGRWVVSNPFARGNGQAALNETRSRYPAIEAEATLLARCGPKLADVLVGHTDPLQLLFPGGDLSAATRVYRDSPGSELMNHLLSRAVAAFIERTDEAQSLRVLEIGGGTGATTSCVLPLFPADRTEYIFTDISPLFVARMKTQSADVPFLSTRVLDIEKDPLSQGLVPHSFEVVIAAQVLHATQDLQQTLNHARTLLSPKGLLLLLEPTTACLSTELVTGLLDGWWRFTDFHLRPSCPFLSASEWQALLSESGFGQTATISPTETAQASVQAAVVLAQLEPGDAPQTKQWIVFSDSGGIGQQLAARLKRRGDRCVVVSSADGYRKVGDGRYEINGRRADDFSALFAEIGLASGDDALGVVYLWNLDTCASPQFMDGSLPDASRDACVVALHLIQRLARLERRTPAGLWIVTRGAIPASTNMNSAGLAASTLWGLGKVAVLEHPELHCVLVDLDPDERESSVSSLLNELGSGASREQVLIRGKKRFVARLARSAPPIQQASTAPIDAAGGYSLAIETRGTPDNLRFVPLARPVPRAQHVQVKVNATGLNFADVMDALGLLPFERPSFGVEFSGEISQLGENVQGFAVGDQVFGAAPASFDSHVTVHTSKVRKIPPNLDFNDAATITVAFATAYYALHEVAKMTRGDRVLIHAAGGGVGLAAIQLAQLAGAEVFATAHPDKWERLKHYGVQHVMNSRTTAFAEEVLSITNGQGVDIVLNSLTGDMIPKSLAVLRQGGRFIEIGKRDIWSAARVAGVNAGVQYVVVDLLAMIASEDQSALAPVLDSLLTLFNDGRLKPLPRTVFSLGNVVPAFRYMQQAKHFGKVVLDHRNTAEAVLVSDERPVSFREDATYLIIGGTGGLGLVAAEWLSTRGARHIVLMGRREPAAEVIAKIQRIETLGAKIVILRGDVSSHDDVSAVLQHISNSMPPLRGILHSALALDDAVLLNQNAERFEHAFAPKVNGAWLLHTQTSGLELDFFILFSAGASLLGNQGQANYAAANAFLDSLAHYRRQRGLSGMSINWGPWARVGVAATRERDERRRMIGVGSIEPAQGMAILDRLYAWNPVQVGVLPIRWAEVAEHFVEWPLVSGFRSGSSGPAGDPEFLQKLDGLSVDDKRSLIAQHIKLQMAGVLGLKDPNIPLQSGFFDLGMDSLTAVELRNKLQATFGCTLPPTLAFDYPTVGGLIDFVSREVLSESEAAVEPETEEPIDHDLSALLSHVEQQTDLDALGSLKNNRMRAI